MARDRPKRCPRQQIQQPRCPYCSKRFTDVLRHLNHRQSKCANWFAVATPRHNSSSHCYNPSAEEPVDFPIPDDSPNPQQSPPPSHEPDIRRVEFPSAAKTYGQAETFMDRFDNDKYSGFRATNIYYPFSGKDEWELASFLLSSGLSMKKIDNFLRLKMIQDAGVSFSTAKALRGRAELLPKVPDWKVKKISLTGHATREPMFLFYRDALSCVEYLLGNPLFSDCINFCPVRLYQDAEQSIRVYTEWVTGNAAWEMQSNLPDGATLLGVILSSDKTNISAMTGNRVAHPVLLSLANIAMDIRMKSSSHAFVLVALLPCPKFLAKERAVRSTLENRVVHLCLDIITHPLKLAARAGRMMADPLGYSRFCFTALASYIVDTPEATMIACVAGKTSHLTMADYRAFGDPARHESRTASTTLAQLAALATETNPLDLSTYLPAAKARRLNGVHLPFWRNWYLESPTRKLLSDPSQFLTPEPLHHWHKQFWDHDAKWAIRAVGADKFDFRFATIQPVTGFKYFKDGVSKLKQVTGRAHRDVERYIVCVIAGKAPPPVVIAIRALMDFRYLAQSRTLNDNQLSQITASLQLFHNYKQSILDAGARVGKGNKPMDHFQIPKLELMHSVAPSVTACGAVMQWSADITEHAHITEIKVPGRSGNNQSYNPQICRWLDRSEKHRNFALALSVRELQLQAQDTSTPDLYDEDPDDASPDVDSDSDDGDNNQSNALPHPDLFSRAAQLSANITPTTPLPLRTLYTDTTAFQLNFHPSLAKITVDEAATKFKLPDLRAALADYIRRSRDLQSPAFKIGQRRSSPPNAAIPFTHLRVWYSVRMQMRSSDAAGLTDPQRVRAMPATDGWPFGRYDTVLLSNGTMPGPGLGGYDLAQIRLIFHPIWPINVYLTYAERFEIIPHPASYGDTLRGIYPDPITGQYVVKRSTRANGSRLGDIIPLLQARIPAPLVPRYGVRADPKLTSSNSLEYSTEFYLNRFFDKELYYFFSQNKL